MGDFHHALSHSCSTSLGTVSLGPLAAPATETRQAGHMLPLLHRETYRPPASWPAPAGCPQAPGQGRRGSRPLSGALRAFQESPAGLWGAPGAWHQVGPLEGPLPRKHSCPERGPSVIQRSSAASKSGDCVHLPWCGAGVSQAHRGGGEGSVQGSWLPRQAWRQKRPAGRSPDGPWEVIWLSKQPLQSKRRCNRLS